MTVSNDTKDRAIYHMVMSELHRMQGLMLNLQTLDDPYTAESLQERMDRDQSVTLGRLTEWRQRRPEIYNRANADFQQQLRALAEPENEGGTAAP